VNRTAIKHLVWITGRGVVLAMRAIQEKQDDKWNLEYWYRVVKFKTGVSVNEHT
jgi:hypothetical protein